MVGTYDLPPEWLLNESPAGRCRDESASGLLRALGAAMAVSWRKAAGWQHNARHCCRALCFVAWM